jgi:hypothetical protein
MKKKKLPIAVQALFISEATGGSDTERTERDSDCFHWDKLFCKKHLQGKLAWKTKVGFQSKM